jgi:hypothetical protein
MWVVDARITMRTVRMHRESILYTRKQDDAVQEEWIGTGREKIQRV